MKLNKKIILSIILVIVWMIFIFIFSEMPSDESNKKSKYVISKAVETVEKTTEKTNGEKNDITENINKPKEVEMDNKNSIITNKLNSPLRKCAHASVYLILSIFVTNAILEIKNKLKFQYGIVSIIFSFLYACTDEFHQLYVQGRTGQFTDVLIDTLGAILGFVLFYLIYKIKHKNINKIEEEIL